MKPGLTPPLTFVGFFGPGTVQKFCHIMLGVLDLTFPFLFMSPNALWSFSPVPPASRIEVELQQQRFKAE